MATVGQQLTAPETGWKRYDDTNSDFSYVGDSWGIHSRSGLYNGSLHYTYTEGNYVAFNFLGSKLRIIGALSTATFRSSSASVYIDGEIVGTIKQIAGAELLQTLDFEVTGLSNTEHIVKIVNNQTIASSSGVGYLFDAIDIDETGELKPYEPAPVNTGNILLRVTMNDSSERQYKVTQTVVDGFISWYDRTVGTGNTCYSFDDSIDGSKEYLAFEKIISFKVIPLPAE